MKKLEEMAMEYAMKYPEQIREIVAKAWLDGRKSLDPKKTLEERKAAFANKLVPFVEMYGKEMVREFYDYWTEINEDGRKMRFEKEKAFEISKRLARWKKNNDKNGRTNKNAGGSANQSVFGFTNQVLQERERQYHEHQGCPDYTNIYPQKDS